MTDLKKQIMDMIDSYAEELYAVGDDIFDHPETGLEEVHASALLEDLFEREGFVVERGLGSLATAFRAVYEVGEGGPSIGLLAEYDALPGIGHACGHHLQGPCMVGAARAIKRANLGKPYKLVVYGTPAEENVGGKSEAGHAAIVYGAKVVAGTAYDLIMEDGLMERVRADFEAAREKMKSEA